MELKIYQRRVVDEVERYLAAVARQRDAGNKRHAATDAWRDLRLGEYRERQNSLEEDLPTFCIKVPTGGGKTLLATQALGSIYRTLLKDRNGAGLVVWVVPGSQIYRDTLRRLRDRHDMYRLMLEHAVSRRIEIWEKHEIARLSPTRLRDCLNILVVQLASTNRETKEQLKFFKDSGGNIVLHFPPENDMAAQRAFREQTPNLKMIEDDEAAGRHLVATSVGNLVKLCRPPVILDEGHKATSSLAQQTIEDFNASVVIELSATPRPGTNILIGISGNDLLAEEMIKLPLNIATSGQKAWKDVLTQARDKREALARKGVEHASLAGADRLIRPLILVQVERTGKDQQESGHIHSEQVKAYLIERLGVAPQAIAIKSSEKDDIEGIDLLDPNCLIEWIITKSALQEGWDCPFAYILVSLNNTGSGQSMTQLVGRILRQPYQERTPHAELNESYVYCLHKTAGEIAKEVKTALEKEGYEGNMAGQIVTDRDAARRPERTTRIEQRYLGLYQKPFEGKIYLPHFCVRDGRDYEPLDYFRHLIAEVDVAAFPFGGINWPLAEELRNAKDRFYRLTLGEEISRQRETETDLWETDAQVRGWLTTSLAFDYLSPRQVRHVVDRVYEQLCRCELSGMVASRLALVKFVVRDKLTTFIQEQVDKQTEAAFGRLFEADRLCFYLQCAECRFPIPDSIKVYTTRPLFHDNGDRPERSLFDYVDEAGLNNYERVIALCLDRQENILWWYRNLVGANNFAIQGWRRNKIHPDFVAQQGIERPVHTVLVLEGKGDQLMGNQDTKYKQSVADYFEKVGKQVTWQQLGQDFKDHVFRFQVLPQSSELGRDWQDELRSLLSEI